MYYIYGFKIKNENTRISSIDVTDSFCELVDRQNCIKPYFQRGRILVVLGPAQNLSSESSE